MPKLAYLEFYSNNITHVDDFRSFYDKEINLAQNPWHCGVALSWMGEDLDAHLSFGPKESNVDFNGHPYMSCQAYMSYQLLTIYLV